LLLVLLLLLDRDVVVVTSCNLLLLLLTDDKEHEHVTLYGLSTEVKASQFENITVLSKSSIAVSFILISTVIIALFSTKFEKMKNKIKSTTPAIDWKAKPVFHSIGYTMKRYHNYLSIFTGHSSTATSHPNVNVYKKISIHQKILLASFLMVFGLFIQTLQYYTVRTDLSHCSTFYDQTQCITYQSSVSFEDYTCQWDRKNLLCEPIYYPNGVPMVTLFYIVIMTSFFSQIAYVILHYFCNEIFTNPSISTIAAKAIPLEKTPSGITY
jgi:hypothetical protein